MADCETPAKPESDKVVYLDGIDRMAIACMRSEWYAGTILVVFALMLCLMAYQVFEDLILPIIHAIF